MRGSNGKAELCGAVGKNGAEGACFGIGGARAVKPYKGHSGAAGAIAGGNALVKQVAGKDKIHFGKGAPAFFKGGVCRKALHFAFGLFPGFFSEAGIFVDNIKICGKRAFALFFGADRGGGKNTHRSVDNNGLFAYFVSQNITS